MPNWVHLACMPQVEGEGQRACDNDLLAHEHRLRSVDGDELDLALHVRRRGIEAARQCPRLRHAMQGRDGLYWFIQKSAKVTDTGKIVLRARGWGGLRGGGGTWPECELLQVQHQHRGIRKEAIVGRPLPDEDLSSFV